MPACETMPGPEGLTPRRIRCLRSGGPGLMSAAPTGGDTERREARKGPRLQDVMLSQVYIHFFVALAGLASFLSPCVLPLVPPYLTYLGGTTLDQLAGREEIDSQLWRRVVLAAVFFVLGFTTVFVGLGAGASVLGQWIQAHKNELSVVAGIVIILFGLHFLGVLRVPLFYREARFHTDRGGASLAGAYVMGLAFAFG